MITFITFIMDKITKRKTIRFDISIRLYTSPGIYSIPESVLILIPVIPFAKIHIRYVGIYLLFRASPQILLVMIIGITTQYAALKIIGSFTYGFHVLLRPGQHRSQIIMILAVAEYLRMYNKLVLGINQGLAVISLDDSMGSVQPFYIREMR